MRQPKTALAAMLGTCAMLMCTAANSQSVWVSDQFEITMRTGPTSSNAITRMLSSGTELQVLDTDADAGYTHVRTNAGTEGWVLTRYLMGEPPAREQLEQLTNQLTDANAAGSSMTSQLQAIRGEQQNATQRIRELESQRDRLTRELDEIKKTAANVLAIDSQNKTLQQQLMDAEIQVSSLEDENESLGAQRARYWFITGALVLTGGILLGLILPKLKFQRRSRYDRL